MRPETGAVWWRLDKPPAGRHSDRQADININSRVWELTSCPSVHLIPPNLIEPPGCDIRTSSSRHPRTLHPPLLPCSTYCCLLIVPCGLPTVSVGLVIIKVFFGTPYTFYPASHHRFNLNLDARAVS